MNEKEEKPMKRHVMMTVVVLMATMLLSAARATDPGPEPKRKRATCCHRRMHK
jgi:hypothetical protein